MLDTSRITHTVEASPRDEAEGGSSTEISPRLSREATIQKSQLENIRRESSTKTVTEPPVAKPRPVFGLLPTQTGTAQAHWREAKITRVDASYEQTLISQLVTMKDELIRKIPGAISSQIPSEWQQASLNHRYNTEIFDMFEGFELEPRHILLRRFISLSKNEDPIRVDPFIAIIAEQGWPAALNPAIVKNIFTHAIASLEDMQKSTQINTLNFLKVGCVVTEIARNIDGHDKTNESARKLIRDLWKRGEKKQRTAKKVPQQGRDSREVALYDEHRIKFCYALQSLKPLYAVIQDPTPETNVFYDSFKQFSNQDKVEKLAAALIKAIDLYCDYLTRRELAETIKNEKLQASRSDRKTVLVS